MARPDTATAGTVQTKPADRITDGSAGRSAGRSWLTERLSVRPAAPDDLAGLYHVASVAPQHWERMCGRGVPAVHELVAYLDLGVVRQLVVEWDAGPDQHDQHDQHDQGIVIGCAELYDHDGQSATAWAGVAIVPGPIAEQVRLTVMAHLVDEAFTSLALRKLYALHHGFEAPLFSDVACVWHEESRTPDAYRHDSHYWDEVITAIYRTDWQTAAS